MCWWESRKGHRSLIRSRVTENLGWCDWSMECGMTYEIFEHAVLHVLLSNGACTYHGKATLHCCYEFICMDRISMCDSASVGRKQSPLRTYSKRPKPLWRFHIAKRDETSWELRPHSYYYSQVITLSETHAKTRSTSLANLSDTTGLVDGCDNWFEKHWRNWSFEASSPNRDEHCV